MVCSELTFMWLYSRYVCLYIRDIFICFKSDAEGCVRFNRVIQSVMLIVVNRTLLILSKVSHLTMLHVAEMSPARVEKGCMCLSASLPTHPAVSPGPV